MVFENPNSKLWLYTQVSICALGLVALVLGVDFVTSVLVRPTLPQLALPDTHGGRVSWIEVPSTPEPTEDPAAARRQRTRISAASLWGDRQFLRTAFVVQEAPRSIGDLRNNIDNLDVVFPDCFKWTDPAAGLKQNISREMQSMLAGKPVMVLPMVSNADAQGNWHGSEFGQLLSDSAAAGELVRSLADACEAAQAEGINLDFESLAPEHRDPYVAWITTLAGEFHRRGMFVTVDVPLDDPAFDYAAIGRVADAVVLMGYDEHYAPGKPGAIASGTWFNDGVDRLLEEVPPQKLIVALGAFGYDWDTTSGQPARSMSFTDAMVLADNVSGAVETDRKSLNSHFHYREADGDEHDVWFLDAITAWNQFVKLQESHVGGYSLWRLGLEDPGIWNFLNCDSPAKFDRRKLTQVSTSQSVIVEGEGEVYRVLNVSDDGRREVTFDGRLVDYAGYTRSPHYASVEKRGRTNEKKLALTFDDGPDPTWTPKLLSILKQNDVKATFFLVGDRAQLSPQIVAEEYASGHVLGNHTFSHPHIGRISDTRLKFEMDATQRMIEAITGHETVLFRSPFDTDTTPLTGEQFEPLRKVCQRGYHLVGADIDSDDTEMPGAERMVSNVLKGIEHTGGNIIVFHDAGTDRQQTLDAVAWLIPLLKHKGYEFVTVDQLIGLDRDTVMPPAPASDRAFIAGNNLLALARSWLWPGLWLLLLVASALSVIRVLGLGVLIGHSAFRRRKPLPAFTPRVLVMIPAYNEGKVIARTIESLLQSDYPDFGIQVVDDGSTDDTAAVVRQIAQRHPSVSLVTKNNGGKYSALNLGFHEATEEYIVTIDADTIIMPQTIRHLMAPFADPSVDAVCGNVQVGNINNMLTTFQDVEYVTTQNYDRRAFESLNCITVVPGATGAWKRQTILNVGGYSRDTLTEDADLTITLLRHGGKIVYAPLARSVTEAPEQLSPLFKQRFRWRFGMLQCLWKHRAAFGHGLLGWVAMPNIVIQILFELLSPLCDLLLIVSLIDGQLGALGRSYLFFLALDLFGSMVAFILDRHKMTTLLVIPLQRFYYRPFLYLVTLKSVIAMLRGWRHGWNKLERTASVTAVSAPDLGVTAPAA